MEEEIIQNPEELKISTEIPEEDPWKTKYLYSLAEFDNYRKRTVKEKEDLKKYAVESLIQEFIPIKDDIERALASSEDTTGIEIILKNITELFKKHNIEEINPQVGEPFNTDYHTAIGTAEGANNPDTICSVVYKGYTLNGKVIRYSGVIVNK